MINISLIIVLFLSGIFLGFVMRTNKIIKEQIFTTARTHFKNIVLTRRWNAAHGGVYVEKNKGIVSNPYLENPDITAVSGKVYTKKNPALMTREISELAKKAGDFRYRITSLKPLNPDNAPDRFEKKSLTRFEAGNLEASVFEKNEGKTDFRYMAPLFVEEICLNCHTGQGYQVGDIRGGISVSFDVSQIEKELEINKIYVSIVSIVTALLLIAIIFTMVSRLEKRLDEAHQIIAQMAVTDELTQLYNRRYFHTSIEKEFSRSRRYGHPISLLMIDIDHFKRVNDTFGHQTGDEVLTGVADIIRKQTRDTDTTARYGGEEMAVILPGTDLAGAVDCARKICLSIEEARFKVINAQTVQVTVSIGVSTTQAAGRFRDLDSKTLIKQADDALYRAKESGRNQVISCESENDNRMG